MISNFIEENQKIKVEKCVLHYQMVAHWKNNRNHGKVNRIPTEIYDR